MGVSQQFASRGIRFYKFPVVVVKKYPIRSLFDKGAIPLFAFLKFLFRSHSLGYVFGKTEYLFVRYFNCAYRQANFQPVFMAVKKIGRRLTRYKQFFKIGQAFFPGFLGKQIMNGEGKQFFLIVSRYIERRLVGLKEPAGFIDHEHAVGRLFDIFAELFFAFLERFHEEFARRNVFGDAEDLRADAVLVA